MTPFSNRRRRLCALITTLLAAGVGPARARERKARVGIVFWSVPAHALAAGWPPFRTRMAALGWMEGRNLELLFRSAELKDEAVGPNIAELIRLRVDVLIASHNRIALAAKKLTTTIPIVALQAFNPVEAGLVQSIARPGGNVTGILGFSGIEIDGKKLALLKEAAPATSRVAYLSDDDQLEVDRLDPTGLSSQLIPRSTEEAATQLGIVLVRRAINTRQELESAFSEFKGLGIDGLFVDSPRHLQLIVELARRHRLPAIYSWDSSNTAGGLMSYVAASPAPRAADLVDKILRGARPSELPMEHAQGYDMFLNLKAAKAIGLEIPGSVRMQATRIVQ